MLPDMIDLDFVIELATITLMVDGSVAGRLEVAIRGGITPQHFVRQIIAMLLVFPNLRATGNSL